MQAGAKHIERENATKTHEFTLKSDLTNQQVGEYANDWLRHFLFHSEVKRAMSLLCQADTLQNGTGKDHVVLIDRSGSLSKRWHLLAPGNLPPCTREYGKKVLFPALLISTLDKPHNSQQSSTMKSCEYTRLGRRSVYSNYGSWRSLRPKMYSDINRLYWKQSHVQNFQEPTNPLSV